MVFCVVEKKALEREKTHLTQEERD